MCRSTHRQSRTVNRLVGQSSRQIWHAAACSNFAALIFSACRAWHRLHSSRKYTCLRCTDSALHKAHLSQARQCTFRPDNCSNNRSRCQCTSRCWVCRTLNSGECRARGQKQLLTHTLRALALDRRQLTRTICVECAATAECIEPALPVYALIRCLASGIRVIGISNNNKHK